MLLLYTDTDTPWNVVTTDADSLRRSISSAISEGTLAEVLVWVDSQQTVLILNGKALPYFCILEAPPNPTGTVVTESRLYSRKPPP